MFKFSPFKVLLGVICVGLGADQILRSFDIKLIPFEIPLVAYYIVLIIAGIILIYRGFIPFKIH